MASETVEFIASFVIIVTVIAGGIINSTQSLTNAFNYDVDQASSLKAKDVLLGVVENLGAPSDWTVTNAKPTVFGLKWPSSVSSTPSPFGMARIQRSNRTISYGASNYYELSKDEYSLLLDKKICLDYSDLIALVDPNDRYDFQISFKPVMKISTTFNTPTLEVSVWGPSGPVTGATVSISVFDVSMMGTNPISITRVDFPVKSTISGDCSFDLTGVSAPFFVYIRANYGSLSSASYYSSASLSPSAIVPIVTNYATAEVSLVHRKDVGLYSDYDYSGGIKFNSTFLMPLEENILQSTQPTSGTILLGQPPAKESLTNFKATPGILLAFYERTDTEDFGLVLMPWGMNSLGVESTFGPEPDHVVNVVTQSVISNIGGVTYNTEVKLWRDILSTETVSGICNVTITSNPTGGDYVIVDGTPINTPQTYQWARGSSHDVYATSIVNAGSKTQNKFIGWSDGGAQSHAYTVSSSTTISANYKAQYQVSFGVTPIGGGTLTPSVTAYFDDGEKVNIAATASANYGFDAWLSSNSSTTFSVQDASTVATIGGPGVITAKFIFGVVSVTITSDPAGAVYVLVDNLPITTPKTFNWVAGSSHKLDALSPIAVDEGTRYVYTSWSDSGSQSHQYVVTIAQTVTARYNIQYKASFKSTGLDSSSSGTIVTVDGNSISSLPYDKWYNSGSTVAYSYNNPVASSVSGKQFRLSHVNGPASGISITSPIEIEGFYIVQYKLTFGVTPFGYGTTDPTGTNIWVDEGTLAISATATSGHIFSTWTSTGPITVTGLLNPTTTATINGPGTLTAVFANGPVSIWIMSSPSGSSFVRVDGVLVSTPIKYSWDVGSTHIIAAESLIPGVTGTQYIFSGWSDGGLQSHDYYVSTAANITANFKTQYYWRFTAVGLDGPLMAPSTTIVTIGGNSVTYSQLPYTDWFDQGTPYTYSPIVASTLNGKRFSFMAPSTLTPPSGGNPWWTVAGSYKTQHLLTINTQGLTVASKKTNIFINGVASTDDYGISQISDVDVLGWRKWIDSPNPSGTFGVDANVQGFKFDIWSDATVANPHLTVTMNQPRTYTVVFK